MKRAAELARRSEELNRQLLKLAQALNSAIVNPAQAATDPPKPASPAGAGRPSPDGGILAEVRDFLDGPEGNGRRPRVDPRD